jgi:hypothetical protein
MKNIFPALSHRSAEKFFARTGAKLTICLFYRFATCALARLGYLPFSAPSLAFTSAPSAIATEGTRFVAIAREGRYRSVAKPREKHHVATPF